MARTPEGRFQDKVVRDLEENFGAIVIKNTGRQGFPDLTAFLPENRTLILELKVSRPSPSSYEANQEYYLAQMRRLGFDARTITPENWDMVKKDLRGVFRMPR